jgi:hypothetical protein
MVGRSLITRVDDENLSDHSHGKTLYHFSLDFRIVIFCISPITMALVVAL